MDAQAVMLTSVPTVSPDASLREIASPLAEHPAGAAVLIDGSGSPAGIVSESIVRGASSETDARVWL